MRVIALPETLSDDTVAPLREGLDPTGPVALVGSCRGLGGHGGPPHADGRPGGRPYEGGGHGGPPHEDGRPYEGGGHGGPPHVAILARLLLAVRARPAATVAVVTGEALGGGLGLVAACDVVIAHPRARFGLPEALFGLVPAIVSPLLRERARPAAVRRLALTGDAIGAEEALRIGLVDAIDANPDLDRLGRSLARAETRAVAWLKALPDGLADEVLAASEVTAALLDSPVVQARRDAFAEGFAPWEVA